MIFQKLLRTVAKVGYLNITPHDPVGPCNCGACDEFAFGLVPNDVWDKWRERAVCPLQTDGGSLHAVGVTTPPRCTYCNAPLSYEASPDREEYMYVGPGTFVIQEERDYVIHEAKESKATEGEPES